MDAASPPITMPIWPAWLMFGFAAACTYPAMTSEAPSEPVRASSYTARGQEPGWLLTIGDTQIDYRGDYGETRITVPRPEPRTTFNGHRYETARLVVDVTHSRCNDAMSGFGFADQVTVTADGKTFKGCGGERRADWDQ